MDARATVRVGAITAIAGALLSGPVGLWLLSDTYPQPEWSGPEAFAVAFHPVQVLPFVFGLALVVGLVITIAGAHEMAHGSMRGRSAAGLALSAAFAAMILINYTIQIAVVPGLALEVESGAPFLSFLTMANPRSLSWAIEMWGYAVLGMATWLVAPAFEGASGAWARRLFVVNGPVSIASAVAAAIWPAWLTTTLGLAAFLIWNALLIAMMWSAIVAVRQHAT